MAEIRRLAKPQELARDTQLRFVERTLLFGRLATDGWLPPDLVRTCEKMAGFRNIVVHQYLTVDPAIVRSIVESQLDDLLAFVRAIRSGLDRPGG